MRSLVLSLGLLTLAACGGVSTDANGIHTQAARSAALGNTKVISGLSALQGADNGTCSADSVADCGGSVDGAEYRRLAQAGKLRFTYPDGSVRLYQPK